MTFVFNSNKQSYINKHEYHQEIMNHAYNNKYKFKKQLLQIKYCIWPKMLLNGMFPFLKFIHMHYYKYEGNT